MNELDCPIEVPHDEVARIAAELVRLNDLAGELAARRVRHCAGSLRWLPDNVLAPRRRRVLGA